MPNQRRHRTSPVKDYLSTAFEGAPERRHRSSPAKGYRSRALADSAAGHPSKANARPDHQNRIRFLRVVDGRRFDVSPEAIALRPSRPLSADDGAASSGFAGVHPPASASTCREAYAGAARVSPHAGTVNADVTRREEARVLCRHGVRRREDAGIVQHRTEPHPVGALLLHTAYDFGVSLHCALRTLMIP